MLANTLDREALKHVDQSAISATSNASDLINALLNVDNFNVDCVTAVTRLLKEACNDTKRSVELPVDKMCCLFKRLISTTTPGDAQTFEATNVFKEVKPGDYTKFKVALDLCSLQHRVATLIAHLKSFVSQPERSRTDDLVLKAMSYSHCSLWESVRPHSRKSLPSQVRCLHLIISWPTTSTLHPQCFGQPRLWLAASR